MPTVAFQASSTSAAREGPPATSGRPRPVEGFAPAALAWRHLDYAVSPGARNMAIDHALAASVGERAIDQGVLRLYGWATPTVSLGRNEPAASYDLGALRAAGLDVVRRPTGGRAVVHDRELTYAVIVPLRALGGARAAHARVHAALATALLSLGAEVEVVGAAGRVAPGPDAGPCFRLPVGGEVVARGRKIVGSAQARIGGALLQHGSILLDGDQGALGAGPVESSPITLRELIGDVTVAEVSGAVAEALRAGLGGTWTGGELSRHELSLADQLERERYGSESWTCRR